MIDQVQTRAGKPAHAAPLPIPADAIPEAQRFLDLLAPGERVTFQTFDDDKTRKDPSLAHVLHGTLDQRGATLAELNARGAGIFWMVNEGDGEGRKAANVQRVRALFVDLDGAPMEPVQALPLPYAIVESSPGKWHAYWRVVDCEPDDFGPLQKALAAKFKGDPSVCDSPRVMRLPGFMHRKGEPFQSRIVDQCNGRPYSVADLHAELCLDVQQEAPRTRDPKAAEPVRVPEDQARGRAIEYLTHEAPEAIEGAGGDRVTFTVAARVRDFGVSEQDALTLMLEHWNDRQSPPWSPEELATPVGNAYRYASGRQGGDSPQAAFEPVEVPPQIETESKPAPDTAQKPAPRYRLWTIGEVLERPAPEWLVHELFPARGIALIYGEPGAGKSFVALDLAAAIARGTKWLDRDVKQGCTAYVSLEGAQPPRVRAYMKRHRLKPADMKALRLVDGQSFDLLDPKHEPAVALAQSIEAQATGPVRAVFIDTLSRAMPGGNENASETMSRAVEAAQAIADALKCLVILIHHSGKDSRMGARGHSSLHGAADAEIKVSRSESDPDVRFMRADKVKDGEDGMRWEFRLERVELGADATGNSRRSMVLANVERARRAGGGTAALPPGQATVFMALRQVIEDKARDPLTADDVFAETIVTRDEWRDKYFDLEEAASRNPADRRKLTDTFRKAVPPLVKGGHVNDRGNNRYALPS